MELPPFMTGDEPAIPATPESGLPNGAPEGFVPGFNQPAAAVEEAPVFDFSALEQIATQGGALTEGSGTPAATQLPTAQSLAPDAPAAPEGIANAPALSPEMVAIASQMAQGQGLFGQVYQQMQALIQEHGSEEAVLDQLYAPDASAVVASVDAELAAKYERFGLEYDPANDPQQAIAREMLYEQRYQQAQAQSRTERQAQAQAAQAREQAITASIAAFPYADATLVRQAAATGLDPRAVAQQYHASFEAQLAKVQQAQAIQSHPARMAPSPLAGRTQQGQAAQGTGNLSLPPVPDGIKNPGAFAEYERQLLEASQRMRRA